MHYELSYGDIDLDIVIDCVILEIMILKTLGKSLVKVIN